MDAITSLRFIQSLSGFTQTALARELGVSFVTLNRWINGKARPSKDALRRIDRLLAAYSGVPALPPDVLTAKKAILENKSRSAEQVVSTILKNPDIHDELVLVLTYNTNQIEGSTLTQEETAVVLFQNGTVPRKTLAEQLEAKNHQTAMEHLFRRLAEGALLDETFILTLHGVLMNGLREDAGMYRRHGVRIVGANIATANHLKVPQQMGDLIVEINRPRPDVVAHVAEVHSRFEQIHPFSDGNGRIGRLLIHAMLLRRNVAPAVIRREKKRAYYATLNTAQRIGDHGGLEDFLCDAIFDGWRILERKDISTEKASARRNRGNAS